MIMIEKHYLAPVIIDFSHQWGPFNIVYNNYCCKFRALEELPGNRKCPGFSATEYLTVDRDVHWVCGTIQKKGWK